MRKLLSITILLSNFFTVLASLPAYAVAPPPKFLLVGSASSCVGSANQVTDFVVDYISGDQYLMYDYGVCRSTDNGAHWSAFDNGGPLNCPPSNQVHLKKFNVMPNGRIVAFTGGGAGQCNSTKAAWWLDNVENPTHATTWTISVNPLVTSTSVIFSKGAPLSQPGGFVATMSNATGSGQGRFGAFVTLDNGITWSSPLTPLTTSDTFGAIKDPGSNYLYISSGGLGGGCPNGAGVAYTSSPDGSVWDYVAADGE